MRPFRRQRSSSPQKKTPHHYVLAHLALRQAADLDPYAFFSVMGTRRREELLEALWLQVCASCDEEGAASFIARDITVHTTIIGKFPTALIVMPEPHFTAEAYMVCVILQVPIDELEHSRETEFRYFTLEKEHALRPAPTELCRAWKEHALELWRWPRTDACGFLGKARRHDALWAPAGHTQVAIPERVSRYREYSHDAAHERSAHAFPRGGGSEHLTRDQCRVDRVNDRPAESRLICSTPVDRRVSATDALRRLPVLASVGDEGLS